MKRFFTLNKIEFRERDISRDKLAYQEWKHKYQGDIVPLIVFGKGERIVDGADIDKIKKILAEYAVEMEGR